MLSPQEPGKEEQRKASFGRFADSRRLKVLFHLSLLFSLAIPPFFKPALSRAITLSRASSLIRVEMIGEVGGEKSRKNRFG